MLLHMVTALAWTLIHAFLILAEIMPTSEPNVLHLLESGELPITKQLSHEAVVEEFVKGKVDKQQKHAPFVFVKLSILFLVDISWRSFYIGFLWFSGICVACVFNFVYFALAVYLSLGWALHLNRTRVFVITQRVLILVVSLFLAVHLILLYLYQFQSAQEEVPRSSVTAEWAYSVFTCICMHSCLLVWCSSDVRTFVL